MRQWPLVLLILFIQETVTLNGLLVETHLGQYSIWLITLFFIIFTIAGIVIGHFIGKYVKQKWNKGHVRTFAKKWTSRLHSYIGKHASKIYLLLLGYFSFPYLNSFITSWLDIPFWESFWYLFFGNMLFYITSWLLVLGITSIVPDPVTAFIIVILATIIVTGAMRLWKARKI